MVTWVGAALQGTPLSAEQSAGLEWADSLLGDGAMQDIRDHFAGLPPDQPERERVGAILACIWIAQADQVIHEEERRMLVAVVDNAGVAPWRRAELLAAIDQPVALPTITSELTHPGLRELVFALGWRLAASDGDVANEERSALAELAQAWGITPDRVQAIGEALSRP